MSFGLLISPAGSAGVCRGSCSPKRSRRHADLMTGRGLDCSRWPSPFQRSCPRARAGSPRFPGDPSRDFAPVHDPGRPVAPRHSRRYRCCPHTLNNEGVIIYDFEAYRGASSPAVYTSRRALPHAMQDSLPAGGLRRCRAGVEPAGSLREVSAHVIYMDASRFARDDLVCLAGRLQFYIRPVCAGFCPAGPDGICRSTPHSPNGLVAQDDMQAWRIAV